MATKITTKVEPNTLTAYNQKHCGNIALITNLARHTSDWGADAFFERLFNGDASKGIVSLTWYPLDIKYIYQTAGLLGDYEAIRLGSSTFDDDNDDPVRGWKMKRGSLAFEVGSITLQRHFNHYLDYSPYTRIKAWLPYIGYVELAPEIFYGHEIKFKYVIDFESASCTCFVENETTLLSSFNGQIGVAIPIGSSNVDQRIKSFVGGSIGYGSGAVALLSGVATANPVAIAGGVTSMINSAVGAFSNASPTLQGGDRTPLNTMVNAPQQIYLYIERPIVRDYGNPSIFGKPLSKTRVLGNLSGYTIVEDLHLENLHTDQDATDCAIQSELSEIETLLKSGVIL